MKPPSKPKEDILSPIQDISEVYGDMYYSQGNRAWSIIQLKNEILKKFPRLKNREDKFGYKMVIPQSQEEIKKLISNMDEDKVPVLLFFCKKEVI